MAVGRNCRPVLFLCDVSKGRCLKNRKDKNLIFY